MIKIQKIINTLALSLVMIVSMQSAQAAYVNFSITGDILLGNEAPYNWANDYGLAAGDTITASGMFDDSVLTLGTGTISFANGSGNSLTIYAGSQVLTASNDSQYFTSTFPSITLFENALTDFDYIVSAGVNDAIVNFDSYATTFSDVDGMVGDWQTEVTLTAVPVPAALWLFGSGLIALVGFAKRKQKA